jgi:regulator of replication initiation timing
VGAIASKFEAHISELTSQLEDVRRIAEEGAAREGELRLARDRLESELADAREAAAAEATARAELADRLEAVRAEASEARRELDNVRAVREKGLGGEWEPEGRAMVGTGVQGAAGFR